MLIKNRLPILEKIYKRKDGITDANLTKLMYIHTFFYNILNLFKKSNRKIKFSKYLEYATFTVKKFENESFTEKHSFDLSSELHVNKYELLFILNSVSDILEQYRNISQFFPLPDSITIFSSLQNAFYFR